LKYRVIAVGNMYRKSDVIKVAKMILFLIDVWTEVIIARYRIFHLTLVSDRTETQLTRHLLRHFPQFCAASFLPNWHFRFVSTFLGPQLLSWHNSVTRR